MQNKHVSNLVSSLFCSNRRRLVKLVPGQKLELAQARFESPVCYKHTGRKAEPLLGFLFSAGHKNLIASLINAKNFQILVCSRDFLSQKMKKKNFLLSL